MKKKILSTLLALTMAVSLCACGSSGGSKNSEGNTKVTLGPIFFTGKGSRWNRTVFFRR